jgi:hypothetical protein
VIGEDEAGEQGGRCAEARPLVEGEQLDADIARRQHRALRGLGAARRAAEAPPEPDLLRLDHRADPARRGGQIQRAKLRGLPAVERGDREDVAGTEVREELDLQPDPV